MTSPFAHFPDPSALDMGAIAMFEMFKSLRRGGFGKWEALFLVAIMATQPMKPDQQEGAG